MTQHLPHVRPFAGRSDCERMVDYFVHADPAFLRGMGVDPGMLPDRDSWIESVMADLERPDHEKDRCYLAWVYDDTPVGHSSINKIKAGEEAFIHMHMWVSGLRQAGLGTKFCELSATEFMRRFELQRLYCEPYAENPAPNRVVLKCGFRFIKTYRTTPGPFNFEQDVNRYVLERVASAVSAAEPQVSV